MTLTLAKKPKASKATAPKKSPLFPMRLTDAERARYKREAAIRDLTMAELFRRGANLYIEQVPPKKS